MPGSWESKEGSHLPAGQYRAHRETSWYFTRHTERVRPNAQSCMANIMRCVS